MAASAHARPFGQFLRGGAERHAVADTRLTLDCSAMGRTTQTRPATGKVRRRKEAKPWRQPRPIQCIRDERRPTVSYWVINLPIYDILLCTRLNHSSFYLFFFPIVTCILYNCQLLHKHNHRCSGSLITSFSGLNPGLSTRANSNNYAWLLGQPICGLSYST
jgi:hypothetical protein